MKQRLLAIHFFAVLLIAGACGGETNKSSVAPLPDADTIFLQTAADFRKVAWGLLSEEERATVIGDPAEAQVTIVRWEEIPLKKSHEKPSPESIYKVTFETTEDAFVGPIVLYFDPVTKELLGRDGRH